MHVIDTARNFSCNWGEGEGRELTEGLPADWLEGWLCVLNMSRKDGVPEGMHFLFPAMAWWVKDCRM
jgi:hypothetical protein